MDQKKEYFDLKELTPRGGLRTSTQSVQGPTNRSGPLDRCMRADGFEAKLFQLDPVDIKSHLLLTNHSPLFIFTGDDMVEDSIQTTLSRIKGYISPGLVVSPDPAVRKIIKVVRKPSGSGL